MRKQSDRARSDTYLLQRDASLQTVTVVVAHVHALHKTTRAASTRGLYMATSAPAPALLLRRVRGARTFVAVPNDPRTVDMLCLVITVLTGDPVAHARQQAVVCSHPCRRCRRWLSANGSSTWS